MTLRDFTNEKHWNDWLASRFDNEHSMYIVVDLLSCRNHDGSKQWLSEDIICQTARRFRNKVNQFYYGKASRRFGKGLDIAIHYHHEPHNHFHIIVAKPEGVTVGEFKSAIDRICLDDAWLKPLPYFETAEDHRAAVSYNGRYGNDSLVLF